MINPLKQSAKDLQIFIILILIGICVYELNSRAVAAWTIFLFDKLLKYNEY